MSHHVLVSGTWRRIYNPSIRTSAVWREHRSMWVRTSGVWRNFKPDVKGSFGTGNDGGSPTRYVGWANANDPWVGTFGTAPTGNRDIFGDHQIEGIYVAEQYDPKLGWFYTSGPYVTLAGSPAAGFIERLTVNGSTLTSPSEQTSGTYRRFNFNSNQIFSGTETFQIGGD